MIAGIVMWIIMDLTTPESSRQGHYDVNGVGGRKWVASLASLQTTTVAACCRLEQHSRNPLVQKPCQSS